MYHYLTGAASWYMMTMITEVFGIRGQNGNLILYPKLLAEQFDEKIWLPLQFLLLINIFALSMKIKTARTLAITP